MTDLEFFENKVDDLETIPYFPKESRHCVLDFLRQTCPNREALTYVVSQAVRYCRVWPGLAELGGILCSKYNSRDGHDYWCTLPGLSAADNESKAILASQQLKAAGRNDSRLLADLAGADTGLRKRLGLATPPGGTDA